MSSAQQKMMAKSVRRREYTNRVKSEKIQVLVRVRPLSEQEKSKCSFESVECSMKREIVIREPNSLKVKKSFTFNRVFGPHVEQAEVYEVAGLRMVQNVLRGYSCCLLALGQTGTGKTFTMEGEGGVEDSALAGIIPRALTQIFDETSIQYGEFIIRASVVEIYNEEIYDLLSPAEDSRPMCLYEARNMSGPTTIQGLAEVTINNRTEVNGFLEDLVMKRKEASRLRNFGSHMILTITVFMKELFPHDKNLFRVGKLCLVDLASFENRRKSPDNAKETGLINQSLFTLGKVITCLTDRNSHIPYRESKLTRLLKDSLGGKTKTSIIATISPSSLKLDETLRTLNYAHKAMSIYNKPEINQKVIPKLALQKYTNEIRRLRKDLVATRKGNGVYVDKSNYCQLVMQSKEQINLKEEIDFKDQKINDLTSALARYKDESIRLRTYVQDQSKQIAELTEICRIFNEQGKEAVCLIKYYQAAEKDLLDEISTLLSVINIASNDLDDLYEGFTNQRENPEKNFAAGVDQSSFDDGVHSICQLVEKFQKSHARFCAQEKLKCDTWTHDFSSKLESVKNHSTEAMMSIWESYVRCVNQSKQMGASIMQEQTNFSEEIKEIQKKMAREFEIDENNEAERKIVQKIGMALSESMSSIENLHTDAFKKLTDFHSNALSRVELLQSDSKKLLLIFHEFFDLMDQYVFKMSSNYTDKSQLLRTVTSSSSTKIQEAQVHLDGILDDLKGLAMDNKALHKQYYDLTGEEAKQMTNQRSVLLINIEKLGVRFQEASCLNATKVAELLKALEANFVKDKKAVCDAQERILIIVSSQAHDCSTLKEFLKEKLKKSMSFCDRSIVMSENLKSSLDQILQPLEIMTDYTTDFLRFRFDELKQAANENSARASMALKQHTKVEDDNLVQIDFGMEKIQNYIAEYWEKYKLAPDNGETPLRKIYIYPRALYRTKSSLKIFESDESEMDNSDLISPKMDVLHESKPYSSGS